MAQTSTNLGRVAIVPKGTWSSEATYSKLNVVSYAGSSYMAIQNVPAGTAVNNTAYWQVVASKGETGGVGQLADAFSTAISYDAGDYCTYQGDLYRFTSEHSGASWNGDEVTALSAPNFDPESTYAIGDYCAYNAHYYIFTSAHTGAWDSGDVTELTVGEFSATTAYAIGDYCLYGGTLYIFTSAHDTGSWDPNDVTLVTVADELKTKASPDDIEEGTSLKATELETARTLLTDLSSTTGASFDGSADASIGVTGVLAKANGGTGNANGTADKLTTARSLRVNLASEYDSSDPVNFDGSAGKALPVTGVLGKTHGGTGNANGTADKLTHAYPLRTNLQAVYDSENPVTFDGSSGAILPVSGKLGLANGGTNRTDGFAQGLATARKFKVNLAETSQASFDGTADVTNIGVGGILPIARGGNGYGDSGAQSITNSSVFDGTIAYRRIGNLLCIYNSSAIKLKAALSSGSVTLCTISGDTYHPGRVVRGVYALTSDGVAGIVTIGSSGAVTLYASGNSIATNNTIYINIIAEMNS